MRHRKRGRTLGRSPSHRKALLRNLACALILTERDAELDPNPPKVKGRIVTTLEKAKEVRPLLERCITIARKALPHEERAEEYACTAERSSDEWKTWRGSEEWQKWAAARAPVVAAHRRVLQMLGDKQAVSILFEDIAPRFADRPGGYTRILRLARPRVGDAGTQAVLEFVGRNDRVLEKSVKPAFETDDEGVEDDIADDESLEASADDHAAEDQDAGDDVAAENQAEAGDDQDGGDQEGDATEKKDG